MSPKATDAYNETLMATPMMTTYDHRTRCGMVQLHDYGCTDMTGAIRYFTAIDPRVQQIITLNEGGMDTVYLRGADGAWRAITERHPQGAREALDRMRSVTSWIGSRQAR